MGAMLYACVGMLSRDKHGHASVTMAPESW
jgi:hypothetical protein